MSRYKLGSGKVYHVSPEKPFPPCNKEFPPRAHLKDCWQSQESRSERFAKHRKLSPTTSEHTRKFCANSICQLDTLAIDFSPNICFHVVAGTKLNKKRRHKLYLTHNMFMSWWSFRSSYESIITKLCRLTTPSAKSNDVRHGDYQRLISQSFQVFEIFIAISLKRLVL